MTAGWLRTLPLLAGLALALGTLLLGNWQMRRAAEKAELHAVLLDRAGRGVLPVRADTPAPEAWQTVRLTGSWLAAAGIYLDNRTHAGMAGYHVLTPLRLADGSGVVLVNRGWVAAPPVRSQLPAVVTPPGEVAVEGVVRLPERPAFRLSAQVVQGVVWQVLDTAAFSAASGVAVVTWTVQQTSAADDGLVRDWPRPDAGVARHRAYALQWYALAALAAGLSIWHGRKHLRRSGHDDRTPA